MEVEAIPETKIDSGGGMSMEEILFFHKLNNAYASFCVETLKQDGSGTSGHEGKHKHVHLPSV